MKKYVLDGTRSNKKVVVNCVLSSANLLYSFHKNERWHVEIENLIELPYMLFTGYGD